MGQGGRNSKRRALRIRSGRPEEGTMLQEGDDGCISHCNFGFAGRKKRGVALRRGGQKVR